MPAKTEAMVQIFARPPLAGRVKTRLAADIGHREALQIYRALLARTLKTVVKTGMPAEIWVAGTAFHPHLRDLARRGRMPVRIQHGADLGERMWRAMRHGLRRAGAVILIGTDCPGLTAAHLNQARDLLVASNRLVFGPSIDGGYYLVGARRAPGGLFRAIDWGSSRVMTQTRRRARSLGRRIRLLPRLTDLDDGWSLRACAVERSWLQVSSRS